MDPDLVTKVVVATVARRKVGGKAALHRVVATSSIRNNRAGGSRALATE